MKIQHFNSLHGEITVPGDKSISHRSIMLGSLAEGITEVTGFLQGADCLSSISCFEKMGIEIENNRETNTVKIHGKGLHGLTAPTGTLDVGNSGTTTRLMLFILFFFIFFFILFFSFLFLFFLFFFFFFGFFSFSFSFLFSFSFFSIILISFINYFSIYFTRNNTL